MKTSHSYGCTPGDKSEYIISANLTEEKFQENPIINWDAILWVNRPLELWTVQVVLAMISLTEALLLAYLGYKVTYTKFTFYCYDLVGKKMYKILFSTLVFICLL